MWLRLSGSICSCCSVDWPGSEQDAVFFDDNAWYDINLPVTKCPKPSFNADVIEQKTLYSYRTVGPISPPGLTREWAYALTGLHESPYAWFQGHFMRYILRLVAPNFRSRVAKGITVMNSRPLDGLNIRRTDKQEVV